jgi:hypothetical protein
MSILMPPKVAPQLPTSKTARRLMRAAFALADILAQKGGPGITLASSGPK